MATNHPKLTKYGLPLDHFGFQLALGDYSHISETHKFGGSTSLTTTFAPVAIGGTYPTPTSGQGLEIFSDSTADSTTGTGAHKVTVQGLSTSWEIQSEEVTMNSTSAVALTNTYLRVFRAYVSESGSYASQTAGSHVGTITIQSTGGADTFCKIRATDFPRGQSEIGAYTVPTGKTAYVYMHHVASDSNKAVDYLFFQRPNADTLTSPYSAMRMVREYLGIQGMQILQEDGAPLGPFVGPCDIGFMAKAAATAEVSVEFEIILVDDD